MKTNPASPLILPALYIGWMVATSSLAHGQLAGASGSVSASMQYQIYSPGEDINLTVSAGTNINGLGGGTWNLEAANAAGLARAVSVGGSVSAGNGTFSLTAQSGAQAQAFGTPNYNRYAGAQGVGSASLALSFAHPTIISVSGHRGGSGSATAGGSGDGGGTVQISLDGGDFGGDGGDVSVSGIGTSLSLHATAGSSAGGNNYLDYNQSSLGAGAGSSSISGSYDTNVIDPGSLSGTTFLTILGNALGNSTTTAKYPQLATFTGQTGTFDNVKSIAFIPSAGYPTPFGGPSIAHCSIVYSLGATQEFDFSISYQMAARGPLVRFASSGETTATVVYPAVWSSTGQFITNITFQPPSGSVLPVGTNLAVATWYSSAGTSGNCPFEIIVRTNLAHPSEQIPALRNEFPNDSDGDGVPDWQEIIAGNETLDATSFLAFSTPQVTSTNITLSWPAIPGIRYQVESGAFDGSFAPVGGVVTGAQASVPAQVTIPREFAGDTTKLYRLRVLPD